MRTYRFFPGALTAATAVLFLAPVSLSPARGADSPTQLAPTQLAAAGQAQLRDTVSEATFRLDSPRYAEREAASKELVAAGAPAVASLVDVARHGSLEAAVRAVGILESIYIAAGDLEEDATEDFWCEFDDMMRAYLWLDMREAQVTADSAEFALDELERTGRPAVAERAEVALQSHYDIRERRAISEIERLHGKALFGVSPASFLGLRPGAMLPNDLQRDATKGRGDLTTIIIGPKWTGGDSGLKQVARLKRLHSLYRIEGKQVTDNGILRLRAALPTLEVQVRAAAKLGIEHQTDPLGQVAEGCLIHTVKPGEAAANAGLRSHDLIQRFAGRSVSNFDSLIEILHHYNPGDIVEAQVLRNEHEVIIFQLTLTGWD